MDGIALSDLPALEKSGLDLPALGRTVIQSFLRHAVRDGLFHADMHPGNLFVDHQGRLCAVDFGIMGRLGFKERRFLAEILYGFITRDYRAWRKFILKLAMCLPITVWKILRRLCARLVSPFIRAPLIRSLWQSC
jgi:predicted unusual protein kinase regulating ubiquinone biosynthesis (AarF/ABC1/UbiB family)